MKYLSLFILFGLFFVVFTACPIEDSSDVNQDKIYTNYELFYNSNTDKTIVVAKFRFGGPSGTILELTSPASVSFNNDVLSFKALYGGHFKEYAGRITSGTFRYENVDGATFENDIPISETIAFPADLDTISKSVAYTFMWDGTALSSDQAVGLFVGSWTWGQDALFYQNSIGATDIILGTIKLGNLPLGSSTWLLDRATTIPVTEGTSEGGIIKAKFRAENKDVIIIE
ncbi:MAG: hypothetical protein ACTSXK_07985 [Promethearchaeota archaeon]